MSRIHPVPLPLASWCNRNSDCEVPCLGMAVRRRDFIKVIVGATTSLPFAVHGQERVRRVGVLMNLPADDQEAQLNIAAFQQGLQELGWTIGRNLRLDHRWGPLDQQRVRQRAEELIALDPDVMVVSGG